MADIRPATDADQELLARLIRDAFATPAERFDLTPENCPRHPSNCTADWIADAMGKGTAYWLLENAGQPTGCVALECADEDIGYLERLAVLPAHRRRGCGRRLVEHVFDEARRQGLRRIEIGVIAEDGELAAWYERLGFRERERRRFEHLPFTVLFMYTELA
jgi:N-acetylglutamate synthase-like GNAT family acetyltransferase